MLDDAVEYTVDPKDKNKVIRTDLKCEILLNGNQIAVLVPGGAGPLTSGFRFLGEIRPLPKLCCTHVNQHDFFYKFKIV